jgi:hypothetical protein
LNTHPNGSKNQIFLWQKWRFKSNIIRFWIFNSLTENGATFRPYPGAKVLKTLAPACSNMEGFSELGYKLFESRTEAGVLGREFVSYNYRDHCLLYSLSCPFPLSIALRHFLIPADPKSSSPSTCSDMSHEIPVHHSVDIWTDRSSWCVNHATGGPRIATSDRSPPFIHASTLQCSSGWIRICWS